MTVFIVLCLILFRLAPGLSVSFSARAEYWIREMNQSLTNNIRKDCGWTESPGYEVPHNGSDTFYVSTFLPTKAEWTSLQSLPVSLTKSAKVLLEGAHLTRIYNNSFSTVVQWQVPEDHPSQKRRLCYNLTKLASQEGILDLYSGFRSVDRTFYLLRNRRAVIHPSGSVGFNCGYYQGKEGCETRWDKHQDRWYSQCTKALRAAKLNWESPWTEEGDRKAFAVEVIKNCSTKWEIYEHKDKMPTDQLFHPKFYKRVYLLENQWDYNYHHFMADCMARLSRNLKFLRANPDVMIHIRAMEEYDTTSTRQDMKFRHGARLLRNRLFNLLGISTDRIIWDIVLANEVYIPRTLHCAYALSNPIEIRAIAKELIKVAMSDVTPRQREKVFLSQGSGKRKNLIIQQRYTAVASNDRFWNNDTTKKLAQELKLMFPDHNVIIHSSMVASREDYCITCEIRDFTNADILVGNHGAGLTSAMFMPPGGLVVEVVARLKDVNMPVCGYYGPWGSMFGHHHYIYSFRHELKEQMSVTAVASEALQFYKEIHQSAKLTNVTTLIYHDKMHIDVENRVFT